MMRLISLLLLSLLWLVPAHADEPEPFSRGSTLGYRSINAVDVHPHNGQIAIAGDAGLYLYTAEFEQVIFIETDDRLTDVRWSPSGAYLAAIIGRNRVRVWDEFAVGLVRDLSSDARFINIVWRPGTETLFIGEHETGVVAYDAAQEQMIPVDLPPELSRRPILWSPDGARFAIVERDSLAVYDDEINEIFKVERINSRAVEVVAWSPDGRWIAIGARQNFNLSQSENSLRIYDATTGALYRAIQAGHIDALLWSPDSGQILTGAGTFETRTESAIQVWDVATGAFVAQACCHSRSIQALHWADNGDVISMAWDNRLYRWQPEPIESPAYFDQPRPETPAQVLRGHADAVRALAWHPDGSMLASGHDDGLVRWWDAETGIEQANNIHPNLREINVVSWSPDGTRFAVGGEDRRVSLYEFNATGERRLYTNYLHENTIFPGEGALVGPQTLAFSPDSSRIISGGEDATVRLMSFDALTLPPEIIYRADWPVEFVSWHPASDRIAMKGTVITPSGELIDRYTCSDSSDEDNANRDGVHAIAFSPDGRYLFGSNRFYNLVCLWRGDAPDAPVATTFEHTGAYFRGIHWHPTGEYVATYNFQEATVWEIRDETPRPVAVFEAVGVVAWSPDGEMLAVGYNDGTI
jgi:WD40 repeat protein